MDFMTKFLLERKTARRGEKWVRSEFTQLRKTLSSFCERCTATVSRGPISQEVVESLRKRKISYDLNSSCKEESA